MGDILVVYKLTAEDNELLDGIMESLKSVTLSQGKFDRALRAPLAFGMEYVKAAFVVPDKVDNIFNELEEKLRALPNVEDIEQEGMTLI